MRSKNVIMAALFVVAPGLALSNPASYAQASPAGQTSSSPPKAQADQSKSGNTLAVPAAPADPEELAAAKAYEALPLSDLPKKITAGEEFLKKYPDQPRAWYGLGIVAMMEQDGPRAREVFGRLTSGEHAATHDPMVLAWSHVHLGTLYDIAGQPDRAKAEFEAAIAVEGAPEKAKEAASKGLNALGTAKKPERP